MGIQSHQLLLIRVNMFWVVAASRQWIQPSNVLNVAGKVSIDPTRLQLYLIRYFAQTDVDGNIFCLHRLRREKVGLYPEVWQVKNQKWVWSTAVIGLWVGGDCTLEEIDERRAFKFAPEAVINNYPG